MDILNVSINIAQLKLYV